MLYWLFAFEFYTSAITMKALLLSKIQPLTKKTKNTLFLSVTGVNLLLQVILCLIQRSINIERTAAGLLNQFGSLPILGLEIMNIFFSTGLLTLATLKLKVLCRNFHTLNESKLVVAVTRTLFTLENVSLVLYLAITYAYIKLDKLSLYEVALNCHFAALIAASGLLTFFAFIIIELSKTKDETVFEIRGRKMCFAAQVKTDEALN